MEPWKRIEPTKVTKVGWRTIVTKTFETAEGERAVFDTKDSESTRCAGVIALTPDNQIIIAKQFRTGPEKVMSELPGGFVDPGEEPLGAAKRELLEETGYEPGAIEPLGYVYRDAYSNATHHYFLAKDCKKVSSQALEEHELIGVDLISIAQLFENSRTAQMTDTEAVFLAYDQLKELQEG